MKKFLSAIADAETPGKPPRAMLLGLTLLVVAMAAVIGLAGFSAFQREERKHWVEHTMGVQQAITQSLSMLQDAETGQRGFLLTDDTAYLAPYLDAAEKFAPQLESLAALVADNPAQAERVSQFKAVALERMQIIEQTLVAARAGQTDQAISVIREGSGKAAMDRIRVLATEMQGAEAVLLARRTVEDQAAGELLRNILLAAVLGAAVLGVGVFLAFRRFALALSAKNAALENEITARRRSWCRRRRWRRWGS
jgi:CHASE3 domain sensor protein